MSWILLVFICHRRRNCFFFICERWKPGKLHVMWLWVGKQMPAWSSWAWVGASKAPGWRSPSLLSLRVKLLEVVRLWHPSESFTCNSWGAKKMDSPACCPTFSSSPKLEEGMTILERGHSTGFIQLVRCAAGMWVWKKSLEVKKPLQNSTGHQNLVFLCGGVWAFTLHPAPMPAFQHYAKLCPWLLLWLTKPVTGSRWLPQRL